MLSNARVAPTLAVTNMERARRFYLLDRYSAAEA